MFFLIPLFFIVHEQMQLKNIHETFEIILFFDYEFFQFDIVCVFNNNFLKDFKDFLNQVDHFNPLIL